MKNGTSTGVIFVVLILVVILGMVLLLTDAPSEPEQEQETGESLADKTPDAELPDGDKTKPDADSEKPKEPEPGRDVVAHVQEGQAMAQEQEAAQQTPVQEQPTVSEPVQQPQQPQTPQFVPRSLGSGSFRSSTGVDLNLVMSWSAETTNASTVELTVNVVVESYSLQSAASPGALKVYVYGAPTVLNMPDINLDSSSSKVQTSVASRTYTINLSDGSSTTVPLSAEWLFGGVYSGTELPTITCGGDITLSR